VTKHTEKTVGKKQIGLADRYPPNCDNASQIVRQYGPPSRRQLILLISLTETCYSGV